ncbi:MAG: ABC transporter permease [Planctomycetota bacterium]|nr:ABC transporter permease [Planctomycetota bacterium]
MNRLGSGILQSLARVGEATRLAGRSFLYIARFSFSLRKMIDELARIGAKPQWIIMTTAFFVGMALAVQVAFELQRMGFGINLANIMTVALLRELAPVFTGLLLAGFAGAGITAELGGMTLTSQVEALRMLSLDVTRHFIAPICVAATIAGFCLTAVFDLVGLAGGYIVGTRELGIPLATFHAATKDVLAFSDLACGLIKGTVFGAIVGIVGCYFGMKVTGGVRGLADATIRCVVTGMVAVLVSDYFLTIGLLALLP